MQNNTYNDNNKFNKLASAGEKKVVALLNPFYGLEFDVWLFDKVYRYTKEITLTTPKYEKLGEKYAITYSDGKQNMSVLHKLIYDKYEQKNILINTHNIDFSFCNISKFLPDSIDFSFSSYNENELIWK